VRLSSWGSLSEKKKNVGWGTLGKGGARRPGGRRQTLFGNDWGGEGVLKVPSSAAATKERGGGGGVVYREEKIEQK